MCQIKQGCDRLFVSALTGYSEDGADDLPTSTAATSVLRSGRRKAELGTLRRPPSFIYLSHLETGPSCPLPRPRLYLDLYMHTGILDDMRLPVMPLFRYSSTLYARFGGWNHTADTSRTQPNVQPVASLVILGCRRQSPSPAILTAHLLSTDLASSLEHVYVHTVTIHPPPTLNTHLCCCRGAPFTI